MATAQTLPASLPPLEKFNPNDPSHMAFLNMKERHGMYFGDELGRMVRTMNGTDDLIAGMLPARSVNVLVGDSGVGKTPLGYQLALAVAAGVPFLGAPTRPAKVLLMDYENGVRDSKRMLEQQRRHLGLHSFPEINFMFWPVNSGTPQEEIEQALRVLSPDLLVLDSLRSFHPALETGSTAAGREIKKLRALANRTGMAVVLVHHVHKRRTQAKLEESPALDWLTTAAGSRAIINQSDVRLAVARVGGGDKADEGDSCLVLRGHFRTRGEIGPILLKRQYDEDGEPLGYDRAPAGPTPKSEEYAEALGRLPESFSYRDARRIYGKADEATALFLHKMTQDDRIRKIARGHYAKREIRENAASPEGTEQIQ